MFYSLESQKRLRRTTWKKMVTSGEIIKRMNALVEGPNEEMGETMEQVLGEQSAEQDIAVDRAETSEGPGKDPALEPREEPSEDPGLGVPDKNTTGEIGIRNDVPELKPAGDDESDDEVEDDETSDSEDEDMSEQRLRRSERLRARTRRPARYAAHTS